MSAIASNGIVRQIAANRGLLFPFAIIACLGVILIPLPPAVLDLLLVMNITVSVILLVSVIYAKGPLDLAVFPSLLLAVTLFRLVLNIATTRLILTAGDRATDPTTALHAAGEVVQRFSEFVTGGKLAVGVIIFVIIFVIQFVVITKGATRISEVAARFTLDAMPGKQMAIDADLNAGVLNETTARQRREDVAREADFYGAMDGASKFVRGDAIAGIVITIVNILGGFYMGMVEKGWPALETASLFTKLTIGDGLVSQVPAFIVSLAAGLIVTRSSSKSDLGNEILSQLFANPKPLIVAAVFLAVMSVSGLPALPMLVLAACCGGLAFVLTKNESRAKATEAKKQIEEAAAAKKEPEKVEKLMELDAMELEVGLGLVKLVDTSKGGDLLDRIGLIRRQVALELGVVVPPIRIRDNVQLGANDYVIKMRGQSLAKGVTYPDQFMAMDSGAVTGPIPYAESTTEPAFGLPAFWITESQRADAELMNYTVVESTSVLATHLTEVIKNNAHLLLTRQEMKNLLDNLKTRSPALVEELIPTVVKPGDIQRVCQNLLRERVPIRDIETIVETVGDYAARTKDLDVLTEYTRHALARTICKQYVDENDRLWAIMFDPVLENSLVASAGNPMSAQQQQKVTRIIVEKLGELTGTGRPAVVVCSPQVRQTVRRMIEPTIPQAAVLGINEIVPDVALECVGMAGLGG